MTFFFICFLTVLINTFLGGFVFFRNTKGEANRVFALLTICMAGWIATLFLYYLVSEHNFLLFIGRLNFAIATPMTYFFYRFVLVFPQKTIVPPRWLMYTISIATGLLVVLSLFTPLIDKDEIAKGAERILVYGDLYILWVIVFGANLLFGLVVLILKVRRSSSTSRKQLTYLLFGFSLFFISGILFNVILPQFGNYTLQPFSPLTTVFLSGFATYAIVKHKLMNIKMVLIRSVVYTFLIGLLMTLYTVAMYWVAHSVLKTDIESSTAILYACLTIFVAFSFNPIKTYITKKSERIFYKKSYNANQLLSELSTVLATNFGIEEMTTQTLTEIMGEMKISKGVFYVFDKERKMLPPYSVGYDQESLLDETTVRKLADLNEVVLVSEDEDEGEIKEILTAKKISILSILRVKGQATGILVFSDKLTGQVYTEEDIEIIQIFSAEASIALENAKAYEEIRNFNVILEKKIAEATANLRHANSKLRELDKVKDEFISIVSHELRTPLGIIRGYLWMLIQNAKKIPKELQEDVNIAIDSTEHLIALVNDMLDVSRIETSRMSLNLEKVEMNEVIESVAAELLPLAKDKAIVLHSKCDKIPHFTTDKGKIHQILINLGGNAVKFTPQKGTVTIEAYEDGANIKFSVRDTGIGIKKEDIGKLFTKFGRLDTSYTAVSKTAGTGLGLYITKKMIDMLGGKIEIESEFEKGTTFTVILPKKLRT